MRLAGLHHITKITCDAQRTVDFYVDVLGLRLVKKTINFDDPHAYHLYFGDESGTPGSILTWFEYAGARPGGASAGMIHTIQLGVLSGQALEFWESRLAGHGHAPPNAVELAPLRREPRGVLFEIATLSPGFAVDEDPQHLGEELRVPKMHARLRPELERSLTPIVNPRTLWRAAA
jgi:glyoxalase family protein